MAGRPQANVNLVTALGDQAEGLIERGDMLNPGQGHLQNSLTRAKASLGSQLFSLWISSMI